MEPVPPSVRTALTGRADTDAWDPILPLITVDAAGFPHVCLLGRAELEADESRVYAVLAGTTTVANLRATGTATLIVIGAAAAVYCKLRADGDLVTENGLHGVRFTVAHVKTDTAGVALAPPLFRADARLRASERWADAARLLDRIRY